MQRCPLPQADLFQVEETGPDAQPEHPPVELLLAGQGRGVDGLKPPGPTAQLADLLIDSYPAEILEQVVVGVYAINGRRGRIPFVEVPKVLVHEMGERLSRISGRWSAH